MEDRTCLYTCSGEGIHSIPCRGTATLHRGEKRVNERLFSKVDFPQFKFFKQVKPDTNLQAAVC